MTDGYNLYNFEASFSLYLTAENISPVSLKNYLSDLRFFLGWATAHVKSQSNSLITIDPVKIVEQFTFEVIEQYKLYLSTNNFPLKTINRRLSTIRKFFTFCISQGWTSENPAKRVKNSISADQKPKIDETNQILAEFDNYLKLNFPAESHEIDRNVREFLVISSN
jgi:site-specific recombinase XerD